MNLGGIFGINYTMERGYQIWISECQECVHGPLIFINRKRIRQIFDKHGMMVHNGLKLIQDKGELNSACQLLLLLSNVT
jgi:hypothetical protein